MTVVFCQNIARMQVQSLPRILETTTVEEFEESWEKCPGNEIPLSVGTKLGVHMMCKAAAFNSIELIWHIYQKDQSVLHLGDSCGWTPLLYAVHLNRYQAVATFLELGAEVNIVSTDGSDEFTWPFVPKGATSLWIAAHTIRSVAMAKLLLKFGGITAPAADKEGLKVLEQAKSELFLVQTPLRAAITSAMKSSFPMPLLQMIVEYV